MSGSKEPPETLLWPNFSLFATVTRTTSSISSRYSLTADWKNPDSSAAAFVNQSAGVKVFANNSVVLIRIRHACVF